MTAPRDDWDDDERRAVEGLEAEFDELRARHRGDPAFELLRAADAGALPESMQAPLAGHLERSPWSRALVDGASGDEPALDDIRARALLTRMQRSTNAPAVRFPRVPSWFSALAAAAVLIIVVGVLRQGDSGVGPPSPPPPSRPGEPSVPARPVFTLPLERPDVKLTTGALVLRSEAGSARFVDDIAPALDAYRAGDYARADARFASLQAKYPAAIEPAFYRGIAQLFLDDAADAIQPLQAARRLDDGTFAAEIGWYLAVAYERAGDPPRARAELEPLCGGKSAYAARACDAQGRLKSR